MQQLPQELIEVVYQLEGGREFSEDKIRLAVIEAANEKSRFYSLYPFI